MDVFGVVRHMLAPWLHDRFGASERGAAMVEYALLVALIAVVCMIALSFLRGNAQRPPGAG